MELGSGEIILILLVALLVYGGRLPEVARSVGKSLADLKRGLSDTKDIVARDLDPAIRETDIVGEEAPREVIRNPPASPALAKEDITIDVDDASASRHENPN